MIRKTPYVVLALICGMMLFASGAAYARSTHVFSASFGSEGSGAGEVSSPAGLAINATTQDMYVVDAGNFRIDQFSSSGGFIRAWGWGVLDGQPKFEICTLSCRAGLSGSGPGQFEAPAFVAIDNSAGTSAGDVYVGDSGDALVSKFTAEGNLIKTWGDSSLNGPAPQGQLDGSSDINGNGPFGSLAGIAVDPSGDLDVLRNGDPLRMFVFATDGSFVTDFETYRQNAPDGIAVDGSGNLYKLDGEPFVEKLSNAGNDLGQVTATPSATDLTVDPTGGDLYVDVGNEVEQYAFSSVDEVSEPGGSSCTFLPQSESGCGATDSFGSGSLISGTGIGVDPSSDTVYVADASANKIDVFTEAVLPDATTGLSSNVTATGATLEGEVNPDGVDTSSFFEYGPCETPTTCSSSAYGHTAPTVQTAGGPSSGSADDGSGVANVPVEASVSGLLPPNQTYHYRLVGRNVDGNGSPGMEGQFTTQPVPPIVGVLPASVVTFDVAILQATLNPENSETTYQFEYGLCNVIETCAASGYTNETSSQHSSVYGTMRVSREIEGLLPSRAYHYRLVAINGAGANVINGPSEGTFTTTPAPPLLVESATASDIAQTSAVISGTVDPDGLAASYGFQLGTEAGVYGPTVGLGRLGVGLLGSASVMLALEGLQPGLTYHYRLVASTAYTTVAGADRMFTTVGASVPFTQPLALPLLATPSIEFPAVATRKASIRSSKCRRRYQRDKRGKCVKAKPKKKTKGRSKRTRRRRR
ncbi:MAG: hypothetical protein WB998_05370 [Solirubrobacteraceae bacterium]